MFEFKVEIKETEGPELPPPYVLDVVFVKITSIRAELSGVDALWSAKVYVVAAYSGPGKLVYQPQIDFGGEKFYGNRTLHRKKAAIDAVEMIIKMMLEKADFVPILKEGPAEKALRGD